MYDSGVTETRRAARPEYKYHGFRHREDLLFEEGNTNSAYAGR